VPLPSPLRLAVGQVAASRSLIHCFSSGPTGQVFLGCRRGGNVGKGRYLEWVWLNRRLLPRLDGFLVRPNLSLFLSFGGASKLVHHGAQPDKVQKGACLPSLRTVPIPPSCSLYILPLSFAASQCVRYVAIYGTHAHKKLTVPPCQNQASHSFVLPIQDDHLSFLH
jgi:hypothetical protein